MGGEELVRYSPRVVASRTRHFRSHGLRGFDDLRSSANQAKTGPKNGKGRRERKLTQ